MPLNGFIVAIFNVSVWLLLMINSTKVMKKTKLQKLIALISILLNNHYVTYYRISLHGFSHKNTMLTIEEK